MCKLSTKGSMELRIGNICVLIIYIPIFRFGNCKKVPANGILHCMEL